MPVEQNAPELERIVSRDQEMEEIGSGYRVAEGPVWFRQEGYLLFSDIRNNRRMKWAPRQCVTVVNESTNEANGLTLDPSG